MPDILAEICDKKRKHIAACKLHTPESLLQEELKTVAPTRGFHNALKQTVANGRAGLIAEIKKASPSKGLIRPDFHPDAIAKEYEAGGATCLSVLTDEPYFQGSSEFLMQARSACGLPVLRKDFMLDTYQVTEARRIGADCILLIMAALEDAQAQELEQAAHELDMDVLIEVHDEVETERALKHLKSKLLGVNNRNLKTLEIDLNNSIHLKSLIPNDYTVVCESGIHNPVDIELMKSHDIHCFLVGESLMLQRNITEATKTLLGE